MLFTSAKVVIGTVHVAGSQNDLAPWAELPGGDRPDLRLAEFEARKAAALDWIDTTFAQAARTRAPGVLLMMQAEPTDTPGFADIRARIVERSRAFGKPVLLVHGDEHVREVEPGYARVANLTRLETFGDTARCPLRNRPGDRRATHADSPPHAHHGALHRPPRLHGAPRGDTARGASQLPTVSILLAGSC